MVAVGDVGGAVDAKVEHNRQIDTFWLQLLVVVPLEASCLAALVVFLLCPKRSRFTGGSSASCRKNIKSFCESQCGTTVVILLSS